MNADVISPELKTVLRRLKLSRMLDTLPERLALARQQKMPHQDLLLLALSDEATRRDGQAAKLRADRARLEPDCQLERWDETAKVEFDRALLNELASLRFIESHHHVAVVGSVGVGKTFLAHALGHVACRRGYSVLAIGADAMLKSLKHARLTQSHEKELRALLAVDLLIVDDFGLDAMDAQESRDAHEIILERHRAGSFPRPPRLLSRTLKGPHGASAADVSLHTSTSSATSRCRPNGETMANEKLLLEPTNTVELLRGWLLHAHRGRDRHDLAARRYDARRTRLGVPTIVLSAAVGTSVFAALGRETVLWANVLVGLSSVAAAALSALQTFFDYPGRAERHRQAATKYKAIIRELEESRATPDRLPDREYLDDVRRRLDALEQDTPVVPRRIYDAIERRYAAGVKLVGEASALYGNPTNAGVSTSVHAHP